MSLHQRDLPAEDSWRVVDGEHDSFDTSILPSFASDEDPFLAGYPSSGQPSSALPSQLSMGDQASQDSIRDFARHREDDNVILREPFRPTMPMASRSRMTTAAGSGGVRRRHRTLEEELSMALDGENWVDRGAELPPYRSASSPRTPGHFSPPSDRPLLWRFTVVGVALSFLVIYIVMGFAMLFYNFTTYPLALSLLPFSSTTESQPPCVDFSDFDMAHHVLNGVLLGQRNLVALALEAERSQPTFAQLRPLVEVDNIAHKALVLAAFDNYHITAADIVFAVDNVHVSTEDATNGAIYLAESAAAQLQAPVSAVATPQSGAHGFISWLFSPFKVREEQIYEYYLRQRYLKHAVYLSATVSGLLNAVTQLTKLLNNAGDQTRTIIRLGPAAEDEPASLQGQLGWNQWTLLAVKSAQLRMVHNSMQVLNDVLARYSDPSSQLKLLTQDLKRLKEALETKAQRARSRADSDAYSDNCVSRERQVKHLREAATDLRNTLQNCKSEWSAMRWS